MHDTKLMVSISLLSNMVEGLFASIFCCMACIFDCQQLLDKSFNSYASNLARVLLQEEAELTDLRGLGASSSHRIANLKAVTGSARKRRKMPKLSAILKDYETCLKPTQLHVSLHYDEYSINNM